MVAVRFGGVWMVSSWSDLFLMVLLGLGSSDRLHISRF